MISAPRRLAAVLLSRAVRHCSPERDEWGRAMLSELDFVDGDWNALSWAVGSSTTLCRHALPLRVRAWIGGLRERHGAPRLGRFGRTLVALLAGVAIAGGVLALCVCGLLPLMPVIFQGWESWHAPAAQWFVVLVIPEAAYLAAAGALWRHRKSMAAGILLGGFMLITHVVLHVTAAGAT